MANIVSRSKYQAKAQHNKIKRRLELGMGKPGDELLLQKYKALLGYK